MATLEGLEARVAALEADRADNRAVQAAVNALGTNQREMAGTLRGHTVTLADHGRRLESVGSTVGDTNHRVRSLEESSAETKYLLVRALATVMRR